MSSVHVRMAALGEAGGKRSQGGGSAVGYSDAFALDASIRGIPPQASGLSNHQLAEQGWTPAGGQMALPLLSISLPVLRTNAVTMMDIVSQHQAQIAPHAKTPMSPTIARALVAQGAWGASVADLRQAFVMLGAGLNRVLIANEIGGTDAARRLAALVSQYPQAQVYLFVDSPASLEALDTVWRTSPALPQVQLLLDVGCGRGGVADHGAYLDLLQSALALDARLVPAGVACYEGTANGLAPEKTLAVLEDLFGRVRLALLALRQRVGPQAPLLLSAGGSTFFDFVLRDLTPVVRESGNTTLLLRSGACFFSDNGPIRQRLMRMADRCLLGEGVAAAIRQSFQPSLRLWAEVLSRNVEDLAICGLGLRDCSHDQGPPLPLQLWRAGHKVASLAGTVSVSKLNDQHAFLTCNGAELRVGDVVEFGIQHPCTTLDKHQVLYGLDDRGTVIDAYRTFFG